MAKWGALPWFSGGSPWLSTGDMGVPGALLWDVWAILKLSWGHVGVHGGDPGAFMVLSVNSLAILGTVWALMGSCLHCCGSPGDFGAFTGLYKGFLRYITNALK